MRPKVWRSAGMDWEVLDVVQAAPDHRDSLPTTNREVFEFPCSPWQSPLNQCGWNKWLGRLPDPSRPPHGPWLSDWLFLNLGKERPPLPCHSLQHHLHRDPEATA